MTKIIFIGTSEFGLPTLEALINNDYQISAVITSPDKPVGRDQQLKASPIKQIAQKHNLEIWQPDKIEQSFEQVKAAKPDLILTAAYGQFLPQEILDLPPLGALNLHGSLLPKYRGASPIQSAILNHEEKTGVSLILMDLKMDHGPIIAKKEIPIEPYDTSQTLHDKLAKLATELSLEALPLYIEGKIKPQPQDDSQATYTKILTRQDGQLDFSKTATQLEQQVKAYHPWPGSWTVLYNKRVKIIKARAITHKENEAIACTEGFLLPEIIQPEGKKPMRWQDFLRGVK